MFSDRTMGGAIIIVSHELDRGRGLATEIRLWLLPCKQLGSGWSRSTVPLFFENPTVLLPGQYVDLSCPIGPLSEDCAHLSQPSACAHRRVQERPKKQTQSVSPKKKMDTTELSATLLLPSGSEGVCVTITGRSRPGSPSAERCDIQDTRRNASRLYAIVCIQHGSP